MTPTDKLFAAWDEKDRLIRGLESGLSYADLDQVIQCTPALEQLGLYVEGQMDVAENRQQAIEALNAIDCATMAQEDLAGVLKGAGISTLVATLGLAGVARFITPKAGPLAAGVAISSLAFMVAFRVAEHFTRVQRERTLRSFLKTIDIENKFVASVMKYPLDLSGQNVQNLTRKLDDDYNDYCHEATAFINRAFEKPVPFDQSGWTPESYKKYLVDYDQVQKKQVDFIRKVEGYIPHVLEKIKGTTDKAELKYYREILSACEDHRGEYRTAKEYLEKGLKAVSKHFILKE